MENKSISGLTILTIVFITLKLCGVINWSWWWVLAPALISIGLTVLILFVIWIIKGCDR